MDETEEGFRHRNSGELILSPSDMFLMIRSDPSSRRSSRRSSSVVIRVPSMEAQREETEGNSETAIGPSLQEMMQMIQFTSADGPLAQMKKEDSRKTPGISMPGISTIFGDTSLSRRIAWIIVVAVVISIATIQVCFL